MNTNALEVNLRRTAVDVVIPPEARVLLEITAPMRGIFGGTEQLLREFHHAFVGWAETLPDLHRRAMADLYYYNQHPRGVEALAVFCEMYATAARAANPVSLQFDALRQWLRFLEKVATDSGEQLGRNLAPLSQSLETIRLLVADAPARAAVASPGIRRLAAQLEARSDVPDAVIAQVFGLLAATLDAMYSEWENNVDPADWIDLGAELPESIVRVSRANMGALRIRLRQAKAEDWTEGFRAELLAMPDNQGLCRLFLEAGDAVFAAAENRWQGLVMRATWLCQVIGHELLAPVHEDALSRIGWDCRDVVNGATDGDLDEYLDTVFASLGADGAPSGRSRFYLVRELGEAVLQSADPARAGLVIDRVLALDFEYPEFGGFTDEWGVRVNQNHLPNIRMFFRLIGVDPRSAHRLLEALIVHLKLGDIFLADTDLFQRDVSTLLGADIKPVFQQTKALLRLLPVYFNDIGAEGAMRTVSTRLDELRGRRDPLIHFLRKQCHVESNPQLVTLVEEIARFWASGDKTRLRSFVPADLYERLDINDENYRVLHQVFHQLMPTSRDVQGFFRQTTDEMLAGLAEIPCDNPVDVEKAGLLLRLRHEIGRKYELSHHDIVERLRRFNRVSLSDIADLEAALTADRDEQALELLVGILEGLQARILDRRPTEAIEDIYLKRHIAVGIPSMYGRYKEERLEAMGMMFRIESLAGALVDRLNSSVDLDRLDRETLTRVAGWLRLLVRALGTDGCPTASLEMSCSMLDDALARTTTTRRQFVNVFQRLSHNVQGLVRHRYMDVYGTMLERLGGRMIERGIIAIAPGAPWDEALLREADGFLRGLIADSLALSRIDALVAKVLHGLTAGSPMVTGVEAGNKSAPAATTDLFVRIGGDGTAAGLVTLGNKGFMLNRLARCGLPIPPGFIITSDLGRAGSGEGLSPDVVSRIRAEVGRLEAMAGARFGDPNQPILLSVRGGSPISMPGMLDSFLNVGINLEITEGIAGTLKRPWAAWDSYRRFLQFWGMSHGVDRDLFDHLILEAKRRQSVPKKSLLPAARMKELALEYRELVNDHGITIIDDPFEQLLRCVELVLGSWHAPKAQLYREEMQIAEEWGTAVVVQRMVFGNLHDRSGTGVVQTRRPGGDGGNFELYGDFIIHGQGDDVVSGLVDTFPITERQRLSELDDRGKSLEEDFPEIFAAVQVAAATLIDEHGLPHQEIEFTFQGELGKQLYVLQSRDAVDFQQTEVGTFIAGKSLERALLARGIGVGGGAFSGRVARTMEGIERIHRRYPGEPVLLVRPDTVPDDIGLLLLADGLLTGIGGATSHAAVVAKRLGKPCVVGCRRLRMLDDSPVRLGDTEVSDGEYLSISGTDGRIYAGKHPVTMKRIRGAGR